MKTGLELKKLDGHPAFVRANQMQRVFDKPDEMNV